MHHLPTALITGASSGIGATYASRLARRGYNLVLVARDEQQLTAVAAHLTGDTNREVTVLAADLTTEAGLASVEDRLRTDRTIDLLLNNAGIVLNGEVANADPERLEAMIRLNVLAPTRLAASVIPRLVAGGRGTIINMGSAVALAPEWVNGAYSGTKAYLLNLTLKLEQELAGTGVRVQCVMPGAVRTGMWEKAGIDIVRALPAEALMDPDEMVDAALEGLDRGETITIPALPDRDEWETFEAARRAMLPHLSRAVAAPRYFVSGRDHA